MNFCVDSLLWSYLLSQFAQFCMNICIICYKVAQLSVGTFDVTVAKNELHMRDRGA
ncbi:hypothetical protein ALC62_10868 [Cyphomyrmex costatus]|uniref:Uncharacterized protein n=1 Tax=Cyphomyrmex costatus TaxID=456900 RepID=A0A151IDG3_9HYME|nr:hypothetical protein ALC62_10868 [Cyphomyrmex costatus]